MLGRAAGDEDRLVYKSIEFSGTYGIVVSPLSRKPQINNFEWRKLTGGQKRDLKVEEERLWDVCKRKLMDLKGMSEASRFLEPVDWKNLGLPLYPNIVRNPMDLGTISKKLDKSEYSDIFEFNKDMMLVWSNARKFNQPGSIIHKAAGYLAGIWKNWFSCLSTDPTMARVSEMKPRSLSMKSIVGTQRRNPV